ncbi:hypothetical protein PoB_002487100 [Plakobranchus ocellatus]|uniref:Uncharacterized protein n=1 Tax=Plakobranchus ocellatus TaxID=259542 RepID=A0AAV3ZV23_9GAST|nr:hypothetical protein PoB_002487100 [Plakobranchus ocellatus]
MERFVAQESQQIYGYWLMKALVFGYSQSTTRRIYSRPLQKPSRSEVFQTVAAGLRCQSEQKSVFRGNEQAELLPISSAGFPINPWTKAAWSTPVLTMKSFIVRAGHWKDYLSKHCRREVNCCSDGS